MSNQRELSSEERKKNMLVIIAFVILLMALAVCIAVIISKSGATRAEESSANKTASALERGFVQESDADNIMAEMEEKVAEGMFECKMTTFWTFDNADAESPNSYVANVESNRNTIYFDVYESKSNDLLYTSPMLPVGTEIRNIKLDKKLPAGDYDAVVMYTLVDENYEEVSSVGFNITISITQ